MSEVARQYQDVLRRCETVGCFPTKIVWCRDALRTLRLCADGMWCGGASGGEAILRKNVQAIIKFFCALSIRPAS